MTGKRLLAIAIACAVATPMTALAARQAGGRSIVAAPTIALGAQIAQNSATDQTAPGQDAIGQGCFLDVEYWKLPLTAGDKVEFKGTENGGRGFLIAVFSPDTTDKNVANAVSVAHGFPAEHKVTFKVDTTGVYPVTVGPNCYNGTDGAFTFSVGVTHGTATVSVSLEAIAQMTATGTITAKVAGSSGVLKLYGTWGGKAHLIATAHPANGAAAFKLHLPASLHGKMVSLQVTGSGAASAVRHVKIA